MKSTIATDTPTGTHEREGLRITRSISSAVPSVP